MNLAHKNIFISIFFTGIVYEYYFLLNYFPLRVASIFGILLFYYFLLRYFHKLVKSGNGFVRKQTLLLLYITATFITLILSVKFNVKDIITLMLHPFAFLAYFMGIVAFLVNQSSLKVVIKLSYHINNLIPIITILDVLLFNNPVFLTLCHAFILFEYCFAKKKRKRYLLLLMLGSLPLFLMYDYRSGILLTLLFIIVNLLVYYFQIFNSKFIKVLFLLTSLSVIYFITFNFTEAFQLIAENLTGNVVDTTDTRTFLFLEFFNDFKPNEFFFGRGYLGKYYSPFFDAWKGDNGDNPIRFVIEIGFVQILFKGGLFLLIPTIFIFVKSIVNGLFKSHPKSINFLLALWLLIELGMYAVQNIPSFSPHFFIIWILVGILLQPQVKRIKL